MNTFEELQVRVLRAPLQSVLRLLPGELLVLIVHYAVFTETEYLLEQTDLRIDVPFKPECNTAAHYPRVTLEITGRITTLTCREANGDDSPRTRPFSTLEELDHTFMSILCSCRGSLTDAARRALLHTLARQLTG